MERHGMTQDSLERLVGHEASVAKLRDHVTAGRVEGYFQEHRADFDTATIARIEFADEESASRARARIDSGEMSFLEAAQRRFLEAERAGRSPCETFSLMQRRQAPDDLAAAVFSAAPGDVVGPVRSGADHTIVQVLAFAPARLDEPTRGAVKAVLFEDWLEEGRRRATIDWYWGNASRTSQASVSPRRDGERRRGVHHQP
jgi:putative peptide maturation system protein